MQEEGQGISDPDPRHAHRVSTTPSFATAREPLARRASVLKPKAYFKATQARERGVYLNCLPEGSYSGEAPAQRFDSNRIRTSKYTAVNFVPKNLFEQFRRAANIYFIGLAILQMFPYFEINNPFLTLFPICFVLTLTALKDGYEDFQRHRQDNHLNNTEILRLKGPHWRNPNITEEKPPWWVRLFRRLGFSSSMRKDKALHGSSPEEDNQSISSIDPPSPRRPWWKFWAKHPSSSSSSTDPNASASSNSRPRVAKRVSVINDEALDSLSRPSRRSPRGQGRSPNLASSPSSFPSSPQQPRLDDVEEGRRSQEGYHSQDPSAQSHPNPSELEDQATLLRRNSNRFSQISQSSVGRRISGVWKTLSLTQEEGRDKSKGNRSAFERTNWADLQVGDIVHLSADDPVPADLLILSTSDAQGGECFIETKSLDGETNLKLRQALTPVSWIRQPSDAAKAQLWLEAEPASTQLYSFHGTLHVSPEDYRKEWINDYSRPRDDSHRFSRLSSFPSRGASPHLSPSSPIFPRSSRADTGPEIERVSPLPPNHDISSPSPLGKPEVSDVPTTEVEMDKPIDLPEVKPTWETIPVSLDNMLWRGCVLRNTNWVVGMVVYAGHETRIMLNSGNTPSKRSRIEKTMNIQIIYSFFLLFSLCLIASIIYGHYYADWDNGRALETFAGNPSFSSGLAGFINFW